MTTKGSIALLIMSMAVALAASRVAAQAPPQPPGRPPHQPHPHHARVAHGKELQRIEQEIRASRTVTRRIQRDPRASASVKQQAAELDTMLNSREQALAKLQTTYRDFLAQHKADLDELNDLRHRALAIDQRLGEAREAIVQANRPEIDQLKESSEHARELAESLRAGYEADRRARNRR